MNRRARPMMNSPLIRMKAEQEATVWIGQRETGPWTDADSAAFDAWLNASMSNRAAYYRFHTIWKETGRLSALGARLPESPKVSPPALPRWRKPLAAAAAVLVIAGGAFMAYRSGLVFPDSYSTVTGGLQTVPMRDGSRVTLNTDSKVRITIDDRERRIELERGEAYFEAAKDPARPFVVAAGSKRIVAIGTAFSVRREGDDIRVAVTEGAVRVESVGDGVVLAAGAVARAEGTDLRVEQKAVAELEQDLTWRTGTLTFHDTPLAEAVAEFNRYNTRKIVIQDPSIAAIRVGGVFRTTNLDRFIRLIEGPLPIKVTHDGERVLLSPK